MGGLVMGKANKNIAAVRRWTEISKDCYKRGCRCSGCYYNQFFEHPNKCQMKASVLELVRVLGKPENPSPINKQHFWHPRTQLVYKYLLENPLSDKHEISKATGIPVNSVNTYIQYIQKEKKNVKKTMIHLQYKRAGKGCICLYEIVTE